MGGAFAACTSDQKYNAGAVGAQLKNGIDTILFDGLLGVPKNPLLDGNIALTMNSYSVFGLRPRTIVCTPKREASSLISFPSSVKMSSGCRAPTSTCCSSRGTD